jgi:hypothetical protein
MSYAREEYTATTSQTDFTISFPYLDEGDIKVYVDEVLKTVTDDYTIVTSTIVRFISPMLGAEDIVIKRSTSQAARLVTYTAGPLLTTDLNTDSIQAFYMAQEAVDTADVTLATYISTADSMVRQKFSGTGSQTIYTLSASAGVGGSTMVFVSGVAQVSDTYTVATTTLTFTEAPPIGTDNIEVVRFEVAALGATTADLVTYTPVGTGAVDRTVKAVLDETISVKDFDAKGDGATDDYDAFTAALVGAVGGTLFIPNGTYRINLSATGRTLTPGANCNIQFESRAAILDIVATGLTTGTRYLFTASSAGVQITGGKINISSIADANSTVVMYLLTGGSDWSIIDQEMDGNCVYSASMNWTAHVSQGASTTNFSNFRMERCYAHDVSRVYFKATAGTSTQTGLYWINNTFYNCFRTPIALNTPNGTTTDVLISGNRSEDCTARSTGGTDWMHYGIGSGTNVRVVNNHMHGEGDGVHIEEKTDQCVVANNTMELDHTKAQGVWISDNNASGGYISPKNIIVANNVIRGPGITAGTANFGGIHLVNDGTGEGPVDNIVIEGNIIDGFYEGIKVDDDVGSLIVGQNHISNCDVGIKGTASADLGQWNTSSFTNVTTPIIINSKNWAPPVSPHGYTTHSRLYDDFYGDLIADEWTVFSGSDPQAVAVVNAAGGTGGRLNMTTGDDATTTMAVNGIQLNSGLQWKTSNDDLVFEVRLLTSVITDVVIFCGFTDQLGALEMPFTLSGTTLTSNASNSVGVLFDTNATTDNWWLCGVKADVDTTHQDSGIAPGASVMETWRIELSSAGVATFYNDGILMGTAMSAAVTTTTLLTPVVAAFSETATSRIISVDYLLAQQRRPVN